MKLIDGNYWPDDDEQCHPVVPGQVYDVQKAIDCCTNHRTVIQAGGNVGIWALFLSEYFNEVHTFEPDWDNFKCLKKNVEGFSNVLPYNVGLANKFGVSSLRRDPKNVGAHQRIDGDEFICVFLDQFSYDHVDLVILDIEGCEPLVLSGAAKIIDKCRPVIMVEDKGLSTRYGYAKSWTSDWAWDNNYNIVAAPHRDVIMVPQ